MKIGKYKLRRETPKIIWDKRIRPLWDPRLRENNVWTNRFLVLTNNFCDQACWSCSALCNLPFGENPFRWEKHTTPISSIETFLERIDGYRPKYWIRLSGGETTLCGPDYLEEVCELVHQHGRSISLLTNGAKMQECDPDWFEFIHLDEHIVNHDLIEDCRKYFKEHGFKRFQVWLTKEHRDLEAQRTNHITNGLRCSAHMEAITMWRDTVYPCCVLPFIDGWEKNSKVRLSMREAGWRIDNPDLVEVMKDWVNTLQADATHACQTQCWKDGTTLIYKPVSGDTP